MEELNPMNWTDFAIGALAGIGLMYWTLKLLILPAAIDKFIKDHDGHTFVEEFSDGDVYEISIKKKRG